ncbi:MAG: FAD-dependent oxidoreductase [Proteobacteria bacterium]|nr:FAD-dependent oxidoreductase [Pseudomonadota bacterium]
MKAIVLGAGVVGVTSAYFLARLGHQVTVIEKGRVAAEGCSYANGGQLSYSHIETWATKSSLFSMLKAAVLPGSFLSISDLFNKELQRFLFEFYKNSDAQKALENSQKLFALTSYSREVLQKIIGEEKISFDYKKEGILHFYRDPKKLEKAVKNAEYFNNIGCKAQILTAEECLKKEPALIKLFDEKKLAGGIFYEDDASGDSSIFTNSLTKICQEKYGVIFRFETDVKNIMTNHKKITGINAGKEVFVADKYVYALGATGIGLLKGIKVKTKIYPVKGHSLSVACDSEFVAPSSALTDPENKVVYSRLGNNFRIAGTADFCGLRSGHNRGHLNFLANVAKKSFSDFGNVSQLKEWYGFRPFRPNSIPLICEVKKYENLFLNTGHGSLGWTLSAGSGKILADLVSNSPERKFAFLNEELF